MMRKRSFSRVLLLPLLSAGALLAGATAALLATCGPFTDTAADAFCPFVQEVFYLGITTGTTPATYDPTANVTRLQMAAFLARSVDGVLKRGSRRAALDRFWTPTSSVPSVSRRSAGIRISAPATGRTSGWRITRPIPSRESGGATESCSRPGRERPALGRSRGHGPRSRDRRIDPGQLYAIDPSQPAGAVTTVSTALGGVPSGLTFDGAACGPRMGSARSRS